MIVLKYNINYILIKTIKFQQSLYIAIIFNYSVYLLMICIVLYQFNSLNQSIIMLAMNTIYS